MMQRKVEHGVFQDIFGMDLQNFGETLEEDECAMPYYSVRAYRRVNGQQYFVGEMKSYEEPTQDAIALTIKNFKADYAEVHTVFEMLN
jgi:hypothetical protein